MKRIKKLKREEQLKPALAKANPVFASAHKRLASAIKKKYCLEQDIAQRLMVVAKVDLDRVISAVESCREQRQDIDSNCQIMLENSIHKKRSSVKSCVVDKSAQKGI